MGEYKYFPIRHNVELWDEINVFYHIKYYSSHFSEVLKSKDEMQIKTHNEVPLHASQDGCYPKVHKQ